MDVEGLTGFSVINEQTVETMRIVKKTSEGLTLVRKGMTGEIDKKE